MTRKLLTPEERRQQRLQQVLAEQGMVSLQMQLMLYQHELLQRTINAVLTRWANEMLTGISTTQEGSHDD